MRRLSVQREEIEAEVRENDYNLNIPRYVDTSEEEEEVDLKALSANIRETNQAIRQGNESLLSMLGELTFQKAETKDAVEEFMKIFQEM